MRCKEYERWVIKAEDHPTSEELRAKLREHAVHCPKCNDTRRLVQVSHILMEAIPHPVELGPSFYDRLMAQIRQMHRERDATWQALWSLTRKLAAVSSIILLLFLGLLLYDLRNGDAELPVLVETDMEPTFLDGSVTNLVLQTDQPRNDQVLEVLMSSGGQPPR